MLSFIVGVKSTQEELDELRKMFLQLDENGDGTLSIDEIENGMHKIMGNLQGDPDDYKEMMRNLDLDGNGVVDYSEFITAAIDKLSVLNQENLRAAFQMFDKDKSGTITIDELQAVFDGQGGQQEEEVWKKVMEEVDTDGNGEISFDEFLNGMTSMLKKSVIVQ